MSTANKDNLYRKGVGIIILNNNREIFVGKRIDNKNSWQMPQGGIDDQEDEEIAMKRELKEETGISNIRIITSSKGYYYYNLPEKLRKNFWGGKYIGQKQRWFLIEYLGQNHQININYFEPEFTDWKWVKKDQLIDLIVPFKRELYGNLLLEFKNFL